ncbi:hypothetical protein B0H10DRAFT_2222069 [Mycena sp. CBHHK59/15]|nr:hypothetical protein B0H10DRAFT_2222069 [Mycena sp. CBHHK59/15]
MSSNPSAQHDADCTCEDPNARLTSDTLEKLVQFKDNIKPLELTADELDEKVSFLLQYLKASDIPHRDKGCCTHVLGQFHAHFSLCTLADIAYVTRPGTDSRFTTRMLEAWPDMRKWLEYTFENWVISPMFHDRTNSNRYHAFQTTIVSLRGFVKMPELCELMLADEGGKGIFVMLGSWWLYEVEDEFKNASMHNSSLTAAEPLLDLGTFKGGSPPEVFFGCILPSSQDAGRPARVALDRLGSYLTLDPPDLYILDYHIRMLTTMNFALPYRHALLAQHSVRTTTRVLVSLTSGPYDDATAAHVARCISFCLEYLKCILPLTDGFAWTTNAVQIGLLPAMLRCQTWLGDMPNGDAQDALVELLRLLSLYTCTRLFSGRWYDPFDEPENSACWTDHGQSTHLDGIPRAGGIHAKIQAKIDAQNTFSSCSGCFSPSYCSPDCQKEHWRAGHRVDCKAIKALRQEGRAPPMSAEDYDFATKVVIEEVTRRKDEVVRVWKEELPARTPVASLNYMMGPMGDPKGVLVAGSPSRFPPQGYVEFQEVRDMWENVISQDIHREHIIIGAYLPHGTTGKIHFLWMGINSAFTEGTVVERLIKTLEFAEPFRKI